MSNKKYFWLKLKDDFFNQKEIKKLRRIAGGDTYTIIYLKMQLRSLENEAVIIFDGTESNLAEQLSLELDEEVTNIEMTLAFLRANNLIENVSGNEFLLPKVSECIGKEGSSAERVRKHRERKALEDIKGNTELLQCNGEVLQCNGEVLQCNSEVTKCNTEKEKEKEIEIKKEKKIEIKKEINSIFDFWNNSNGLITHKDITKYSDVIKSALKKYSHDEILQAITRLSVAITDDNFYYNNRWNLEKFLKQNNGIANWLDDGQIYNNYMEQKEIELEEKKRKEKRYMNNGNSNNTYNYNHTDSDFDLTEEQKQKLRDMF